MPDKKAFPARSRTRSDYHRRVERTVDKIRENPAHPFTVAELALAAASSEYHFHRMFKAVTGETVAQCIRRHRIGAAARRLVYHPSLSITDIALDCGFSSSANFAKAFRQAEGCTPSQYRQAQTGEARNRRIGKAGLPGTGYRLPMTNEVQLLHMPASAQPTARSDGGFRRSLNNPYAIRRAASPGPIPLWRTRKAGALMPAMRSRPAREGRGRS